MLEVSAQGGSAIVEIPGDNPFVSAGRAPAFVGLEAGAQTAAVLEALNRKGAEGPRIGYVVAIRNARFRTPWLPAGVPLLVSVKAVGSAPPLSIYEISLAGGLVTGQVSTYIAPSPTPS
jgi:predicted hotdog family 3-hydroxylacyl-ACP dehydratase